MDFFRNSLILLKENCRVQNIHRVARCLINNVTSISCDLYLLARLQGKSIEIIGFVWTSVNEIVFVTDQGIELYQVNPQPSVMPSSPLKITLFCQVYPEKKLLKLVKNYAISVNWFSWLVSLKLSLWNLFQYRFCTLT